MFGRFNRWWRYGPLQVNKGFRLNGGGSWMAPPFIDFMKREYPGRRFQRAYEWCAGPGFYGFALLADGFCDELHLSDINPKAIRAIEKTIRRNHLQGRVFAHLGAGVQALPADLKLDLVVGNPPNYYALNPKHPDYAKWKDDLRPNDPGWKIHRELYADIHKYLMPDARVLISEISPRESLVYLPHSKEPYDIRERPALDDFREMIEAGGLIYEDTKLYIEGPGITAEMMISRAPARP